MKKETIKRIISDGVVLIGYLLLVASLVLFLVLNNGIFFSTIGLGMIFLAGLLILPIGYFLTAKKRDKVVDNRVHRIRAVGIMIVAIIMLVCSILFALVIDFVQPLVLNTMTNILMIVASGLLLLGALLELIFDDSRTSFVVSLMLIVVMLTGIIWVNAEGYKDFNEDVIVEQEKIFTNGEGGYATFRIPSILVINHDEINASHEGYELKDDIVLALAEGRKDSSKDTGSIDMVGKLSKDGGKTWSKLMVIYSYKDEIGKFGNPTPVFDRVSGQLIFPYMTATKKNDFDYKTFVAKVDITKDGDLVFPKHEENLDISFDKGSDQSAGSDGVRKHTLMVGPGKSIQLKKGIHVGRLVIPASSGGESFVMYSDDHGATWTKGNSAGNGNECEVVELESGELRMVVRDNTGCCDNHFKQYQRISYSSSESAGESWYRQTEDTNLKASICMSSIDRLGDDRILLTYTDSFYTRANLSIGVSKNGGKSFATTSLYEGPSGYSCVSVDAKGNIFILAEIGKVNYNEELILLKVDARALNGNEVVLN